MFRTWKNRSCSLEVSLDVQVWWCWPILPEEKNSSKKTKKKQNSLLVLNTSATQQELSEASGLNDTAPSYSSSFFFLFPISFSQFPLFLAPLGSSALSRFSLPPLFEESSTINVYILRFHTKKGASGLKERRWNCTTSAQKHIEHRCHHKENSCVWSVLWPQYLSKSTAFNTLYTWRTHGFHTMRLLNWLS